MRIKIEDSGPLVSEKRDRRFFHRRKEMFVIKGKVNTATCFARVIGDEAVAQIRRMCDTEMTRGSCIRIMPDVHAGKGCTIGTTMTITDKAAGRMSEIQTALKALKSEMKDAALPDDLCYLYGASLDDYLHDVEVCQRFAAINREKMAEVILEHTGLEALEAFHTIHNYIDTDEMILRKGAIAAHKGELVLIPINMRDGSVLAYGKGNPDWNFSAPHGAGRIMSRSRARDAIDMDDYRKAMEGIYTTSVNPSMLDEAPMAYKSLEDIIDVIEESVDVIEVLKPVFNYKAS